MTFKSILVPVFEENAARSAFVAAASIARRFDAHIVALHVRQRPTPPNVIYFPLGGSYPTDDDARYKQAEDDNAARLHALFDDLCDNEKVGIVDLRKHADEMGATASWRDERGEVPEMIGRLATAFDIAVVAAPEGQFSAFQERLVEALLFQSGRPVLMQPAAQDAGAAERIVIAWNESAESARAVAAATPFLEAARVVKIVTVDEPGAASASINEIAACLQLHGVETSEVKVEHERSENAVDALEREVAEARADLLVMGAYSHSRWREALLGGFTRHVLHEAKTAVLMAR